MHTTTDTTIPSQCIEPTVEGTIPYRVRKLIAEGTTLSLGSKPVEEDKQGLAGHIGRPVEVVVSILVRGQLISSELAGSDHHHFS